jgi:hypothetical protein
MEWAQLNDGWWTVLEPHFTGTYRDHGTEAQERARERLKAEYEDFAKELEKIRTGQGAMHLRLPRREKGI